MAFSGGSLRSPGLAYKPAQHLTVAPPGAENSKKFDFLESFNLKTAVETINP
jgi:hypothetical protein